MCVCDEPSVPEVGRHCWRRRLVRAPATTRAGETLSLSHSRFVFLCYCTSVQHTQGPHPLRGLPINHQGNSIDGSWLLQGVSDACQTNLVLCFQTSKLKEYNTTLQYFSYTIYYNNYKYIFNLIII